MKLLIKIHFLLKSTTSTTTKSKYNLVHAKLCRYALLNVYKIVPFFISQVYGGIGGGVHRSASFRGFGSLDRRAGLRAPAPTPIRPSAGGGAFKAGGGDVNGTAAAANDDFRVRLDVVMETPVVVVPRHERSFEVLVAHLGAITLKNQTEEETDQSPRVERCALPLNFTTSVYLV